MEYDTLMKGQFKDSTGRVVVDVEICVEKSSVDSYITRAVYLDSGAEVPDDELDWIQDAYRGEIEMYAYSNGSRNHN